MNHADVVIVGGGWAGIATALFLAEGGARPLLLEARATLTDGASGRDLGLLFRGLVEHPYRLVHAMGAHATREIYRFGDENLDLLEARVPIERAGGWWASMDGREPDQVHQSAAALQALGIEAVVRDDADAQLGTHGLGPALFVPGEGRVDPRSALATLAALATGAGATLRTNHRVQRVTASPDGPVVHTASGSFTADAVVFAANAWLPGIDPFFEDKITPVREQALRTAPTDARYGAARAGYGYTWWNQRADGSLCIAGARWATPHLEVGETDDAGVVDAVQAKLDGVKQRLFPEAPEVVERWSWIRSVTCDGLPIIGPMPGQPQWVCCAGFVGNQAGLGVRAARAVADGLLTGRAPGVPAFFTPARFV